MSYYEISGSVSARATRTVSYECENCGVKSSYQFEFVLGETQTANTISKNKTELKKMVFELKQKAAPIALENVKKEIRSMDTSGNYGHKKCPSCGYLQSWMLKSKATEDSSELRGEIQVPTTILTGIFLVLAIVLPIQLPTISYTISCLLSFVLWAIGIFVIIRYAMSTVHKLNEDFEKVDKENTPTVMWSEPEISLYGE